MKIIVLAKQVPNTDEVAIDKKTGTLIRESASSILNPDDANALEAALSMKEQNPGAVVSVLSMGPPQATLMLRECLAMGADDAYLLSSRAFAGADTAATSATLAAGIQKIGAFDIIFAGRQAIDGDTAQVGPQTARRLGIPCVSYVQKIREFRTSTVVVERALEDGYEVIEVQRPCVLTAIRELNNPRSMTVKQIEEAFHKELTVWDEKDLALSPETIGLQGSPTQVEKCFAPPSKQACEILSGTTSDLARALVAKLNEKQII